MVAIDGNADSSVIGGSTATCERKISNVEMKTFQ